MPSSSRRMAFAAAITGFFAALVLSLSISPATAQQVQRHPHPSPVLPPTPWSLKPPAPGSSAPGPRMGAGPSGSVNASTWTALGPASLNDNGFNSPTADLVSGRVTGIAVDPLDPKTIYEAAAGGGVWKTVDGGTTWTPLTDSQVTLAMGAIAVAPTDHLKIYAGTGEANNSGDSNHGYGILVSNDGGQNWSLATAGGAFTGNVIGQISVDPTNENIAYAAVGGYSQNGVSGAIGNFGIYKTTDGGTTWTNVTAADALDAGTPWSSVVVDPNTPNIVYAALADPFYAVSNAVYRSTDSGTTWSVLTNAPSGAEPAMGRIALAVSPAAKTAGSHVLYVAVAQSGVYGNGGLSYFVRSDNADAATPTFTNLTAGTPDFLGGENGGAGQGWYDIAVNVDANGIVYCAGVENYGSVPEGLQAIITSSDLGAHWTDISIVNSVAPHTDNHAIAFDSNNRMIDGNDGGIFRYDPASGGSWTDLNSNLNTIQFQGIGLHPTAIGTVIGGSQDNGTELYSDNPIWVQVQGGDGGLANISQTNPARCYAEYFGVSLTRSDDNCAAGSFNDITTGIAVAPKLAAEINDFYVPYTVDPTNGDHVLYGTDFVNDTTNGGDAWSQIGSPGVNNFNPNDTAIDSIALSPVNGLNPALVYVATGGSFALGSQIFVAQENGASTTWTEVDLPTCNTDPAGFSQGCRVNQISVDPNDATGHSAFAVTSNYTAGAQHVFMTTNEGANWTDITNNLPNQPVWGVQVAFDMQRTAYVSTESGVYKSVYPYDSWSQFGTGLPNAQGLDLELNNKLHLLAVGTHGRGAWEILTQYTLTVATAGAGTGTVTSSIAGINCPTSCSAGYYPGVIVTLTAAAGANSSINGWTGCDSVSTDGTTCSVKMTSSKSITATFAAVPTVTWPTASAITYGQTLSSSTLTGGSAVFNSTNVPGTFTFDSPTTAPNAGTASQPVTFTPTDATNYAVVHGTVSVTVNQVTPVITWAAPANIVYGTALSATQLNASAGIPGLIAYLPAAGTVLAAGPHTLQATFTPDDATNYAIATKTVSLTVTAAPLTVTVNNQTMTLGSTLPTLTGTLTGVVNGDGITATYSTTATSSSPVGPYPITATLNDPNSKLGNYAVTNTPGTLTITKAAPTVTWPNASAITYGQMLSSSTLTGGSATFNSNPVPGAFAFDSPTATPPTGTQAEAVTFTPTDTVNYAAVHGTVNVTVNQAVPSIFWATPAAILYGTPLSATQLEATASVPGTFVYLPAAGTVLGAGSQTLKVTFTPTDSTNYSTNTSTVTLIVNKALLTVNIDNQTMPYGGPLPTFTGNLSGMVAGDGITASFSTTATVTSPIGNYPITATLNDPNSKLANYSVNSIPGTLTVGKATPVITWTAPAAITYGTALSGTQLNATSSVAGTFAYSPAAGTVLGSGAQTLNTTFTPTDVIDYNSATASVTLTVNPATPTVAVTSSQNPAGTGQAVTFTAAVSSPAGTPTGTVTFWDGTTQLGSGTLATGMATYTTSALTVGSHTITAQYSGDANFAPATSAALGQAISSFSIGPAQGAPTSANIVPGGVANFVLTVTPPPGSAVTFTVSGLPDGAVASFSPSTVPAGAGPTIVQFIINLPNQTAAAPQKQAPFNRMPLALGLLLLPFLGLRKSVRRGSRFLLLAILAIAGAVSVVSLSGCGGKASFSNPTSQTPEGVYNLTVTAASGGQTQSTNFTLNVQ
ncbi:MAG TPA: MBG domain-containing protein [Terracidiphilus sp.]|nr:MBG domain-containing protein [Terracidiphilus sp.]